MIVCVDTNVLLQARARKHRFHCILSSLIFGRISWAVSNSIVSEYCEILGQRGDAAAAQTLLMAMSVAAARGTLIHVVPSFQFQVINTDADDNKFTDCAITTHADYVITEDRHFATLANAGYKPQPITPDEFIARYRGVYV